jgi:cytochrome c5
MRYFLMTVFVLILAACTPETTTPSIETNTTSESIATSTTSEIRETVPATQDLQSAVYDEESIALGEQLYTTTCTACHGPQAQGIPGLGKDLVNSDFVDSLDDAALFEFIITGRPVWDTENTTGVDMPPRGGNPALGDDDIYNIIAYLRSIHSDTPDS